MDKQVDKVEVDYSPGYPAPKDMAAAAGLYKLDPEKCQNEHQYSEWVSLVARLLNKQRSFMQIIQYNWWSADPRLPITPESSLGIPSSDKELESMRNAGRFDRCAKELEIDVNTLSGDDIINWCTGGAVTKWAPWIGGNSKPTRAQFKSELITDRLAIASYLPDIFVNSFFMGEVPNWNSLVARLRLVCELKPAELEWVTFMDTLRSVISDRKSNLTSKILKLQDSLRSWYACPGDQNWEFGDIFEKQYTVTGQEKYTPIIAHLLLSICVLNEPNEVLFDAEKYASRACNTPFVDNKMWVTGRHEAIRYLIEHKKGSKSRLSLNRLEEECFESDDEEHIYYFKNDRKSAQPNRRSSSGPTGRTFSNNNNDKRGAAGTGRSAQKAREYPARGNAIDTKKRDSNSNRNKSYTRKVRACRCNALQLNDEEHGEDERCPVEDKLAQVIAYIDEVRASSDIDQVSNPTDDENYTIKY